MLNLGMKLTCIILGFLIFSKTFSSHVIAQEKTPLQLERNTAMKTLARSMRLLKSAQSVSEMRTPATTILAETKKITAMWPEGSGGVSTRAKEKIWDNMDDFKSKLMDMEKVAYKLLLTTNGLDLSLAKDAFISVGRTCGRCHKDYRKPKL